MKKGLRVISLIIAAGLMLTVAGCNKKSDGKVKIEVMTSERSNMEVMQSLVDNFNSNNDKIEIVYTVNSDNISDILKTAYSSNSAPDIHPGLTGELGNAAIKNGWLRELPSEYIDECKEMFVDGSLQKSDVDGKYYFVNIGNGGAAKMVWNKDLFRECGLDPETPPKTWDEFREYARIITSKGNGVKYGFALPLNNAAFTRYYLMIPGAASGLYNADGFDPVRNTYDFGIYKDMINLMKGVISDGSVFPSPYSLDNDTARAQFSEGNIGMLFAMYWDVGVFNDQFPAKCDWGIANYPVFDEVKGGHPFSMGSGGYVMSTQSEHPDEQLEVYKWLNSKEVIEALLKNGKMTSTTMKCFINEDSKAFSDKKGVVEFSKPEYPCFLLDQPKSKPTSSLKLEGKDCFTELKNILLERDDVEGELNKLSERYNTALAELEERTHDTAKYKNAEWSFITNE